MLSPYIDYLALVIHNERCYIIPLMSCEASLLELPNGQTLLFAQANSGDAENVVELHRDAYTATYPGHEAKRDGEPYRLQEADIRHLLDPDEVVADWRAAFERKATRTGRHDVLHLTAHVLEDDGPRLAGYAAVTHGGSGGLVACPEGEEHTGKIYQLSVGEVYRKRRLGIGTAIMYTCANFLRRTYAPLGADRAPTAFLHVMRGNRFAREWYERQGWRLNGHTQLEEWGNGIALQQDEMTVAVGGLCDTLLAGRPWLGRDSTQAWRT